jgi:hypothetical protein
MNKASPLSSPSPRPKAIHSSRPKSRQYYNISDSDDSYETVTDDEPTITDRIKAVANRARDALPNVPLPNLRQLAENTGIVRKKVYRKKPMSRLQLAELGGSTQDPAAVQQQQKQQQQRSAPPTQRLMPTVEDKRMKDMSPKARVQEKRFVSEIDLRFHTLNPEVDRPHAESFDDFISSPPTALGRDNDDDYRGRGSPLKVVGHRGEAGAFAADENFADTDPALKRHMAHSAKHIRTQRFLRELNANDAADADADADAPPPVPARTSRSRNNVEEDEYEQGTDEYRPMQVRTDDDYAQSGSSRSTQSRQNMHTELDSEPRLVPYKPSKDANEQGRLKPKIIARTAHPSQFGLGGRAGPQPTSKLGSHVASSRGSEPLPTYSPKKARGDTDFAPEATGATLGSSSSSQIRKSPTRVIKAELIYSSPNGKPRDRVSPGTLGDPDRYLYCPNTYTPGDMSPVYPVYSSAPTSPSAPSTSTSVVRSPSKHATPQLRDTLGQRSFDYYADSPSGSPSKAPVLAASRPPGSPPVGQKGAASYVPKPRSPMQTKTYNQVHEATGNVVPMKGGREKHTSMPLKLMRRLISQPLAAQEPEDKNATASRELSYQGLWTSSPKSSLKADPIVQDALRKIQSPGSSMSKKGVRFSEKLEDEYEIEYPSNVRQPEKARRNKTLNY